MIFDKNGVSVTRKKIDLKLSEELLSGPHKDELYQISLSDHSVEEAYCVKIVEEPNVDEYIGPKNTNPKRIHYTLASKCEKELKLYHDRLAHLFDTCQTIKVRAIHGLPDNYKKLIADLNYICDAYVFVKNKKKPHYAGTKTARRHGEMLHVDLHEKSILSYHHNHYFVSIIEDYSDADLSQFIKWKSHAGRTIINVIWKLQRQADVKVKIIQCNGASEFIGKNTDLGRYCTKKGIEIRKSSLSCFEENSVAEKANETCWNCA